MHLGASVLPPHQISFFFSILEYDVYIYLLQCLSTLFAFDYFVTLGCGSWHRTPLLAFDLRKTQMYLSKFSGSARMTRLARKPVEMKNWSALYAGNLLTLWRMYLMSYDVAIPCAKILSLRVVYKGNLKFPSKNFFLLWMVESFNGNEGKLDHSFNSDNHPLFSLPSGTGTGTVTSERRRLFFYNHLDFVVHLIFKFLLLVIFVLIVVFVIPGSALILLLYLLITLLFALPSLLIFYLAFHALEKLMNDITS
uniref:Ubiquitin-protein ligase n=1 Tax=Cucumis sativus TaxID=3659 RepID=A0A0A0KRZ4_CUCSA